MRFENRTKTSGLKKLLENQKSYKSKYSAGEMRIFG